MRRHLRSVRLYLTMTVILCVLGTYALTGPYDFNPPASHSVVMVTNGFDAPHKPGYLDPYAVDPGDGTSCATCHGAALEGDVGPSCYYCHGAFWNTEPRSSFTYERQYPDSHTFVINDIMPLSAGDVGWQCDYCHYSYYTGKPDEENYYHAPGHGTPYESGCTDCHGANLDNADGTAVSCYWCHQNQWIGDGLPPDHTNPAYGSELKGGFVWHRFGWDDPYSIYDNQPGSANDSPDGCTRCHGPNLDDGFAPSCFGCHGPGGTGPPTDHDQPKGSVPNYHKSGYMDPTGTGGCTACHGADLTGSGIAPSCFSCHASIGGGHDQDLGGVPHRPDYEDPFGAGGCTLCHGETLIEGPAVSCFTCHGPRWNPHDFTNEPWLVASESRCYVCHLTPEFNPGTATSDPIWNRTIPAPTSGYTVADAYTVAVVGQPTGVSLKCLDCHEGSVAVDEYGTAPTTTYYVGGPEAFGMNLAQHHPVSFAYDEALATLQGGLHNPDTTLSGLTRDGTIDEDMLDEGQLECTSCHSQHDNAKGDYLHTTSEEGLCFKCHTFENSDPLQHHIPGRDDPWGDARGTTFNCTLCHGTNLDGPAGGGFAPACDDCHNPFVFPDGPLPDHHGGDRELPYINCAQCHGDPVTGILTGNEFGTLFAPSCFGCHDNRWAGDDVVQPTWGTPPVEGIIDVDGTPTLDGTVGELVRFQANATDNEGDPLAYTWSFGDGSLAQFPSFSNVTAHAYDVHNFQPRNKPLNPAYNAVVSVTDGKTPPIFYEFQVRIYEAEEHVVDTWTVTPSTDPEFDITFENHSGSLVGVKDDGTLSFGVEFVGVIFWMEMWMDLSGNVFWGTGDTFFGNVDRASGTMSGVVFDSEGGVGTFSGARP